MAIQAFQVRAQTPDPQTQDQKIQELEKKVEDLDQRVKVAERTKELEAEAAAEKARSGATVGAEPTGITIRSNDQNFLLKIGLDIQIDNRTFPGASSVPPRTRFSSGAPGRRSLVRFTSMSTSTSGPISARGPRCSTKLTCN